MCVQHLVIGAAVRPQRQAYTLNTRKPILFLFVLLLGFLSLVAFAT
jgi:hypothetical protein